MFPITYIQKLIQMLSWHFKQRTKEKNYLLSFMQQYHIENPDQRILKSNIPFFSKDTTDAIIWINSKKIGIEFSQYNADAIRKGQKIKSAGAFLSEKICQLKEALTDYLSQQEFQSDLKKKYPNESILAISIDFTDYGMSRLNSLPVSSQKSNDELAKLVLEISTDINDYIFRDISTLRIIHITYFSPKEQTTAISDILQRECVRLGIQVENEIPPTADEDVFIDLNFSYLSGGWFALSGSSIIHQIEQKKIKHKRNYSNGQFDEVWLVLHTNNSRPNETIGHKDTIIQCRLPEIQSELSQIDIPFQRTFLLCLGSDGFILDLVPVKTQSPCLSATT